jgi:hypothetical protein
LCISRADAAVVLRVRYPQGASGVAAQVLGAKARGIVIVARYDAGAGAGVGPGSARALSDDARFRLGIAADPVRIAAHRAAGPGRRATFPVDTVPGSAAALAAFLLASLALFLSLFLFGFDGIATKASRQGREPCPESAGHGDTPRHDGPEATDNRIEALGLHDVTS